MIDTPAWCTLLTALCIQQREQNQNKLAKQKRWNGSTNARLFPFRMHMHSPRLRSLHESPATISLFSFKLLESAACIVWISPSTTKKLKPSSERRLMSEFQ